MSSVKQGLPMQAGDTATPARNKRAGRSLTASDRQAIQIMQLQLPAPFPRLPFVGCSLTAQLTQQAPNSAGRTT